MTATDGNRGNIELSGRIPETCETCDRLTTEPYCAACRGALRAEIDRGIHCGY